MLRLPSTDSVRPCRVGELNECEGARCEVRIAAVTFRAEEPEQLVDTGNHCFNAVGASKAD